MKPKRTCRGDCTQPSRLATSASSPPKTRMAGTVWARHTNISAREFLWKMCRKPKVGKAKLRATTATTSKAKFAKTAGDRARLKPRRAREVWAQTCWAQCNASRRCCASASKGVEPAELQLTLPGSSRTTSACRYGKEFRKNENRALRGGDIEKLLSASTSWLFMGLERFSRAAISMSPSVPATDVASREAEEVPTAALLLLLLYLLLLLGLVGGVKRKPLELHSRHISASMRPNSLSCQGSLLSSSSMPGGGIKSTRRHWGGDFQMPSTAMFLAESKQLASMMMSAGFSPTGKATFGTTVK
mmetsp:Transcript_33085/g.71321  ORF Transcript_33085/g.71321 Transcript_33085/m.71321 type:complete len:302 (-) Transcript_33085:1876-2781(-)